MQFNSVSHNNNNPDYETATLITNSNNNMSTSNSSSQQFATNKEELYSLIESKDLSKLSQLGGLSGLSKKLKANLNTGLSSEEAECNLASNKLSSRQQFFGVNKLNEIKSKSFISLAYEAYTQDKILLLLTLAALVSLSIGIYEDVSSTDKNEPKVKWVEGFAIIIAILVVVLTNSINDYQKEKQFKKLNKKRQDYKVLVKRDGKLIEISVFHLQTGDLIKLETGDVCPIDGLVVDNSKLVMDESSATGETKAINKSAAIYNESKDNNDKKDSNNTDNANNYHSIDGADPFILSGSKVQEGHALVLCLNVGENSYFGRTLMAMRSNKSSKENENNNDTTPLQKKLEELAENIAKVGMAIALLMFVVLLSKYIIILIISATTQNNDSFKSEINFAKVFENIIKIIIQTITIIVVAVPEGLPMAVTLALAYAALKMVKENNLVRILASCETMGNVTVVCTDKTGTLTKNEMTVVQCVIAQNNLEDLNNINKFKERLNKEVEEILYHSVVVNSTAFENDKEVFVGSKTECALLSFLKKIRTNLDIQRMREENKIVKEYPFSSKAKCMSTVVTNSSSLESNARVCVKGASEIVLSYCTKYLNNEGQIVDIDSNMLNTFEKTINRFACDALRTIVLAFKDMSLKEAENLDDNNAPLENLIFIGIVGIEDPLRDNVQNSVEIFKKAGVYVKMITGDNVVTARAIAKKAGIWTKGGVVISGKEFRELSDEQRLKIIPKMQVLARSSPTDKLIVVKTLQRLDEIVAMTGDGTNDGPALKMADVGFSMGITGTEVAKEASAIVLMDDNFNSIVSATRWGRAINDSVRKFLQFQLTVNIAAVVIAFISASVSKDNESVLTTVQLLWVNLIMDTLAALSLATEPPTDELLNRYPTPRKAPLITYRMWKHIIGQAFFQILVNILFIYFGKSILKIDSNEVLRTMVFNVFVFLQVFNELNCRRINDELNIFDNILNNYMFILVQILIVIGQVVIVQFGGKAFGTHRLDFVQWLIGVLIGILSLPIGLVLRLLPTSQRDIEQQIKKPLISHERMRLEAGIKDVSTKLKVFNALRRKPRSANASFSRSLSSKLDYN